LKIILDDNSAINVLLWTLDEDYDIIQKTKFAINTNDFLNDKRFLKFKYPIFKMLTEKIVKIKSFTREKTIP